MSGQDGRPSPREEDRRVRRTRVRLRQALTQLLEEKELREITVRELTALAKVSRGTFYFHYTDIYDLLAQIEQDQLEGLDALMGAILPSMDSQAPPEALLTLFVYLNEHEALCGALYLLGARDRINELFLLGMEETNAL